jgi:opacity protein-like surface antigen
VQGKYYLTDMFAAEAAVDYRHESFPGATARGGSVQASLLAAFPFGRFSAFPLAGAGYYLERLEGTDYHRNLGRFGPHLGGGIEMRFSDAWSVDATYRHIWLSDLDVPGRTFTRSGDQLTFGLNHRFGLSGR